NPEGGIGRERVEMGQKISGLIHDMNCHLAIGNADVDMEPEDEIGARDLLQVFHDRSVSFALGDVLIEPMRKGMRPGRSDFESAPSGHRRELASQADDLLACVADVTANAGTE